MKQKKATVNLKTGQWNPPNQQQKNKTKQKVERGKMFKGLIRQHQAKQHSHYRDLE